MFNLCMWSAYYMELSPEDTVKRLAGRDWHYTELSTEHGDELLKRGDPEKVGKEFGKFMENVGVKAPQGHLWLKCDLAVPNQDEVIEKLKKWIDLFQSIGIRNSVLHAGGRTMQEQGWEVEKIHEYRVKALKKVADYIKDTEMVICIENTNKVMDTADYLVKLIEDIGSPRMGICLDTGHLNLQGGSQGEFIRKTQKHLKALHIADNEGLKDQHMMPYGRGNVNWREVIEALKEIGYSEMFNLEIPGERICPLSVRDAKLDYLKTMLPLMFDGVL